MNSHVIHVLDHRDPATAYRHAIAALESSPAACVPILASAHQEIQPSGIKPGVLSPQGDARAVASDEDVAVVTNQRMQSGLDFRERDW
jgi:hypothetical protein